MREVLRMKISTNKALVADLIIQHFEFDAIKKRQHNESNIEYITHCLLACKTKVMEHKNYYRARRIYKDSKGICFISGIPQNGFSSVESGVAPELYCKPGRANDEGEQVLYISEDVETAVKEVRTPIKDYVSVASSFVQNNIEVFDFSPYTETDLTQYVRTSGLGDDNEVVSNAMLFIKLQRMLTMESYDECEYIISRDLVRIIKEKFPNVSGIKYVSHFTGKNNYALWDENKFMLFSDGIVVHNTDM